MTQDEATENFDIVMDNPAMFYSEPAEILTDERLSQSEKIKLLDEWNLDISSKLSADEEGMMPQHARESADDAVIMEKIAAARADLQSGESDEPGVVSAIKRLWRRL
jgi:hypothetical protein